MEISIINRMQLILLVTVAIIISGCATLDQGQCVTANWYDMGYQDGSAGKSKDGVADYANDCAEYGVKVDATAYRDGWSKGIPQYCTANNGYRVGSYGNYYENSCTGSLKDAFYSAYLLGSAVFDAQSRVDRLQEEVDELGDKASKNDISDERRAQLRRDRKKRKDDLQDARFDLLATSLRANENGF
jgi:hypothetical protein